MKADDLALVFGLGLERLVDCALHRVGGLGRDDDALGPREELGRLEDLELIVGDRLDDVLSS